MGRTATQSGQRLDPVASLGHRPHRGVGQGFPDGVGVGRQIADGAGHVPLPQAVQTAVTVRSHVALNGGPAHTGNDGGLCPRDLAVQQPENEHCATDVRLGVRLALGSDDLLLVVGQGNGKPGHP